MNIHQVLFNIKTDFDKAISTAKFNGNIYRNGREAKTALIRSQKIINIIHEFIKKEFVRCGVSKNIIFPPIGYARPEIKIKGFLKSKNQDVAIIPTAHQIVLSNTLSKDNEKILTVNIRSQLSSLGKNIDTLYERTFAEALNLHLNYPKQCLGELYLIPTHEYDDKRMLENQIAFSETVSKIEDYIRMFQAINRRCRVDGDKYKYERVCLLIADFRPQKPKLYSDIDELKSAGLIPEDSGISLKNLTINTFVEDLLDIYNKRFNQNLMCS